MRDQTQQCHYKPQLYLHFNKCLNEIKKTNKEDINESIIFSCSMCHKTARMINDKLNRYKIN